MLIFNYNLYASFQSFQKNRKKNLVDEEMLREDQFLKPSFYMNGGPMFEELLTIKFSKGKGVPC